MHKNHKPDIKNQRSILKFLTSDRSLVIVIALTAIVYISSFKNQFVWDDELYILNNPFLYDITLSNLKKIFSSYFGGNYHPLTIISLAIDYQIGKTDVLIYHLINFIIHILNTCLVFILVKKIFRAISEGQSFIPFIVALLFAIHPIQVESVAWISERKNLLYSLFFFLSLLLYVNYLGNKSAVRYSFSIVFFILSLLSKGQAVILFLCLICIVYIIGRKLSTKVILEKIPFLILSLLFGIIAVLAQQSSNSVQGSNVFSIAERISFASYGLFQYIIKLVFPGKLSAFYPYPVQPGSPVPGYFYVYIVLVLTIIYFFLKFFRKNKILLFGGLFFIFNISIVIQLFPVGEAIMADRYVYIASIGIFIIIGNALNYLIKKYTNSQNIILTFLTLYVLMLCFKTFKQTNVWKDNLTLWSDVLAKYPENNEKGYHNRGNVYYGMGMHSEALQDYYKLLQISPDNSAAYIGTGLIKQSMNDMDGALQDFNKAVSLKPSYEAYTDRGILKISTGDLDAAMKDLDEAIKLNQYKPEAYINKGIIFLNKGEIQSAIKEFNSAIKVNAINYQAYFYRALAKLNLTDNPGAIKDLDISISLNPTADAFYLRGMAKIQTGLNGCNDLKQSALMGNYSASEELNKNCN